MANMKQQQAFKLYAQNVPLTQIATAVGVSRQTVANWRKKLDWDKELLMDATDESERAAAEQRFIAQLIRNYESALEEIEHSELPKKLELIERYAKSYYKLKTTATDAQTACEKRVRTVAYETITRIADMAIRHSAAGVAEFIADHADEIVALVKERK